MSCNYKYKIPINEHVCFFTTKIYIVLRYSIICSKVDPGGYVQ